MIARHQVVLFLHLMKETAGVRFIFMRRAVNLQTLAQLGLMPRDAKTRVLGLKPDDYVSGPTPDHNSPEHEVWVFGLSIDRVEVYVKIQVTTEPLERCVCISFHTADRPMTYPLRTDPERGSKEKQ